MRTRCQSELESECEAGEEPKHDEHDAQQLRETVRRATLTVTTHLNHLFQNETNTWPQISAITAHAARVSSGSVTPITHRPTRRSDTRSARLARSSHRRTAVGRVASPPVLPPRDEQYEDECAGADECDYS